MLKSEHRVYIGDSGNLSFVPDESIALVVTSPPYPMIEMWDEFFGRRNREVASALQARDGRLAFELMHRDLDRVWAEVFRVLISGGFACINIGDATRKVGDGFCLYPNHSRILSECFGLGFEVLPLILWRKQTNAPNKFMGSGMLPAGAYVTLEHEYVLVLRKGSKREFALSDEKLTRRSSAYFWEERNSWFSDIWDFKGTRQALEKTEARSRSAAFPFELAYRLLNMYSARSDTVLDPFLGTGTTCFAAMASGRDSVGVELSAEFLPVIKNGLVAFSGMVNDYVKARLQRHLDFCKKYENEQGTLKYMNTCLQCPVMTAQEVDLELEFVEAIVADGDSAWQVSYEPIRGAAQPPRVDGSAVARRSGQIALTF
jgi:DNA modification methylase